MPLYAPFVAIGMLLLAIVLALTATVAIRWLIGVATRAGAKWEAALRLDSGDPEGLSPIVRSIETEMLKALDAVGMQFVNRAVHAPAWVSADVAGTQVTVSIDPEMVTVNETRLEAQGYLTPRGFCADSVATVMRAVGKPQPWWRAHWNWEAVLGVVLILAFLVWMILALPAPKFVPD